MLQENNITNYKSNLIIYQFRKNKKRNFLIFKAIRKLFATL